MYHMHAIAKATILHGTRLSYPTLGGFTTPTWGSCRDTCYVAIPHEHAATIIQDKMLRTLIALLPCLPMLLAFAFAKVVVNLCIFDLRNTLFTSRATQASTKRAFF